jgi:hypothetical protein
VCLSQCRVARSASTCEMSGYGTRRSQGRGGVEWRESGAGGGPSQVLREGGRRACRAERAGISNYAPGSAGANADADAADDERRRGIGLLSQRRGLRSRSLMHALNHGHGARRVCLSCLGRGDRRFRGAGLFCITCYVPCWLRDDDSNSTSRLACTWP